jgi:hypothetical protein
MLELERSAREGGSPFSARSIKARARALLVDTPLRYLAAPLHRELTRLEVLGTQVCDELHFAPDRLSLRDSARVTAIVKTFERPTALRRLLRSLHRLFPDLAVIVADDGRNPEHHDGARTLALPFDVGVSAGRQAALAEVATEYTWVLDDDFVLYRGTRLVRALSILDGHRQIDILGGPVIDLPLGLKQAGLESAIYPTRAAPVLPVGSLIAGLPVRDKVPNFFVARSDRLRQVGWDPALKRLDHADFFTRARGVLVTVYDDRFRCLHAQTPFDREYMRQRLDLAADAGVLRERYFA